MQLPKASVETGTPATRGLRIPRLRRHLLILAVCSGCAGNHALWKHAQSLRKESADQRLLEAIQIDNDLLMVTERYRSQQGSR